MKRHIPPIRRLLLVLVSLCALSQAALSETRFAPLQTNTIVVASQWPVAGVPIRVSPPDVWGLRTGWTPFERCYIAGTAVHLTAPQAAESNSFHHWETDAGKYLRTRTVRIFASRAATITAVFLRAKGAAHFVYRGRRRRDTLIASGFHPPLAELFATGRVRGFGIRALDGSGAVLHGPFELQSYGNGSMWMYDGTRARTALIRCYPTHDLLVYVAYTNLPHEFELYPWMKSQRSF